MSCTWWDMFARSFVQKFMVDLVFFYPTTRLRSLNLRVLMCHNIFSVELHNFIIMLLISSTLYILICIRFSYLKIQQFSAFQCTVFILIHSLATILFSKKWFCDHEWPKFKIANNKCNCNYFDRVFNISLCEKALIPKEQLCFSIFSRLFRKLKPIHNICIISNK